MINFSKLEGSIPIKFEQIIDVWRAGRRCSAFDDRFPIWPSFYELQSWN